MATCNNCGGDPDCTHKPELSAQLNKQAARIEALEGALRGMLGWYEAFPMPDGGLPIPVAATARRILAQGGGA